MKLLSKKNTWRQHQQQMINGWYVMSARSKYTDMWSAWAKKTPLTARCPLSEPGEVYFMRGHTRQKALANLTKADLGQYNAV